MRWFIKAILKLILVVVPLLLIVVGAGMLWLSRTLPPKDGNMQVAGISGPVTITKDQNGVPHISGKTRADVATGMGFVHAQERLWQMEVSRMAGRGRLSELFGEATIGTDTWLRTMAIGEAAEASLAVIDEPTMAMLQGYAKGVNAWINRNPREFSARFPVEFVVLGAEPEPWTAVDSLISIKMMSVTLSANVGDEVNRLAFARLGFSAAEINDLMPHIEADNPLPLPDLSALLGLDIGPLEKPVTEAGLDQPDAVKMAYFDQITDVRASNNWVVSGSRTESGMPIVANDPHLGLMAPAIWYLARLEVTEELGEPVNLVGASLPGAPFVFLGRNDNVAWGFTNTAADVQDIFIERVNADNPNEYLTPSGVQTLGSVEETIKVKGGKDVVFTRQFSRHGPILPGTYKNIQDYLPENTIAALQWVALAHDDTTANAGPALFAAKTVTDYQDLMEVFLTPMQSMVVADSQGNIGFIAPGRVPVRGAANQVKGRAPVPGWNAVYDWVGTIDYANLPRDNNPLNGAIGTANTKIVGPEYPEFLTFDWEEPYRQDRIDELVINANEPHTMETSRMAQADIHSAALSGLRDRFIKVLQGVELSVEQEGLLRRLEKWDGQMKAGASAPLIMTAWMRQAYIEVFSDELGPAFKDWMKTRGRVLERLADGETARNWCDRASTEPVEQCGQVLADALTNAVSDLKTRYGEDANEWDWAEIHYAHGAHRPFSEVGLLAPLFDVDIAHQGGPFTLDRGEVTLNDEDEPYANTHAASYRGIYDLSDLNKSTFMHTTGQSGIVFSRHYRDFAGPWAKVQAITIPVGPVKDPEGVWTLEPGGS